MNDHHDHSHSLKTYYLVYFALMFLLAVTVGLAFVNLEGLNLTVALVVASVKSALVIWYFMHVKDNPPIIPICIGAGILMLAVGVVLTFCDYMTR
jgi:cytochrome c oxidase subunit 4